MNKWHEYAENERDFPETWNSYECGDFYDAEYVKDWINRCRLNAPRWIPDIMNTATENRALRQHFQDWYEWYDEWFSQFIEKGEDK